MVAGTEVSNAAGDLFFLVDSRRRLFIREMFPTSSFVPPLTAFRWSQKPKVQACKRARVSMRSDEASKSRRDFVRMAIVAGLTTLAPFPSQNQTAQAAEVPSSSVQQAILPVAMCRHVLEPVERYVREGSWDRARTNVNYCTRILAVKKSMRTASGFLPDDGYYDGLEIAGDVENLFTQLDASVYTPIFIPSEEGVSLEQRKYQTEAFDYLRDILAYLDRYLGLFSDADRQRAVQLARSAKYEIVVDKR